MIAAIFTGAGLVIGVALGLFVLALILGVLGV